MGGLMGKYAAMRHLERRGYILLFHGIFNSNLKKAFYSRLKKRSEGRKERDEEGHLFTNSAHGYDAGV